MTTLLILAECANAVSRLPIRFSICDLAEQLDKMKCIASVEREDWVLAWGAYRRGEAGDAGLVDHTSFVVMRRLGITSAFTNDRHFKAAGFHNLF